MQGIAKITSGLSCELLFRCRSKGDIEHGVHGHALEESRGGK